MADKVLVSKDLLEALYQRESSLERALSDCLSELKTASGNPAIPDRMHPASALIARIRSLLSDGSRGLTDRQIADSHSE